MITLAVALALLPLAEVKVERVEYHGWSDSYRISNDLVDVVVVPKIGRVMRYGFLGMPNQLWENSALAGKASTGKDWNNFGGDKMWSAPQSDWNWPPDPDIDGSAWTAEPIPNGVRITSPRGKKSKVRFVRDITLAPLSTDVHFRNRMDNLGARREMAPWQITQIVDPYSVFLPFEPTGQNPKGWRAIEGKRLDPALHELTADGLRIKRGDRIAYKIGAFSSKGEITASQFGSSVFHFSTRTYRNQRYADGGSAMEVFTSAGADKYVELELLGPLSRMDNGEGAYLETTWRLTQGK
ncbi:hypothetical protein [Fimbriimonas ginsengisoli]|uniref:DUF4380 domain-containing protein n=1 Tax=Fimbriimonas ginsengisoli Gsoil 348 TaxID=661478 RepID=A0A068NX90_FIMGI|nr:hypothetical protein [Fimbriimonas ginsengisoli]AIE87967.1 hypothetical protein OP10G_4599 [Fimbriimonas ginsengisoli Gsoil 348]